MPLKFFRAQGSGIRVDVWNWERKKSVFIDCFAECSHVASGLRGTSSMLNYSWQFFDKDFGALCEIFENFKFKEWDRVKTSKMQ